MIHSLTFTYLDCWWWLVKGGRKLHAEAANSVVNTTTKWSVATTGNLRTCLNTKGASRCIRKSSPQITLLVKTMAVRFGRWYNLGNLPQYQVADHHCLKLFFL